MTYTSKCIVSTVGYKWTAMEANCHHVYHIIMFDNHFGYISRFHANLDEIEQIQRKARIRVGNWDGRGKSHAFVLKA